MLGAGGIEGLRGRSGGEHQVVEARLVMAHPQRAAIGVGIYVDLRDDFAAIDVYLLDCLFFEANVRRFEDAPEGVRYLARLDGTHGNARQERREEKVVFAIDDRELELVAPAERGIDGHRGV